MNPVFLSPFVLCLGLIVSIVLLCVSCAHTSGEGQPAGETAWRPLFNGRSTAGWEMVGPGEFKLVEGEWNTHGGMGLLWYSAEKFGHCEIRVVFKLTGPKNNSGVFIRIPDRPQTPWDAVHKGYEVQIENNGDEWHRTGCLYSLTKARNIVSAKVGEWTTMLITLMGKRTRVEIDGQLVTDFTEGDPVPAKKEWYEPERGPRPEFGYIGLQNHDDETRLNFKEVSVRPLR
jgi:hypothetical protein